MQYEILMHDLTYKKANAYLIDLRAGNVTAGYHLKKSLDKTDIEQLSVDAFIELIVRTKKPQIFAESAVHGDGTDWNQEELSILGDIAVSVPVTAYDDGSHDHPEVHAEPFSVTLLYVPGALLRNDSGKSPADWDEVTTDNDINSKAYYALYERRLLPSFLHASRVAESNNKQAFVTMPGLGCGQFAGPFRGRLNSELKSTLIQFLKKHANHFPGIRAVYYDPYRSCSNERFEINHISLFVRPLTKGNENRPQLCRPQRYEDSEDDFRNCELFSFVAWDHVSWPGNDFYIGSRSTDDGVKAAATNSMAVLTGVEGCYDGQTNTYVPPKDYRNWEDVVLKRQIEIVVRDNLCVLP